MSELNMVDIDLEIIDEQQMELLIEEIGPRGPIGHTPNIQIGTVQSVPPSQDPEVTVTGTPEEPYLNFKLKQGEKGEKGDPGDPSTVMTGATATTPGSAGSAPAPAAGDQDKALFGDATWKKPGLVNSDVENSLTQTTAGKVLDATQGKVLDDKITSLATTVGQNHGNIKNALGIVEDGNTATQAIAKGQYVIWKDALYTADAPISIGETLASSGGSKNLTAKPEGGLNALNSNLAPLPDYSRQLHNSKDNYTATEKAWFMVLALNSSSMNIPTVNGIQVGIQDNSSGIYAVFATGWLNPGDVLSGSGIKRVFAVES